MREREVKLRIPDPAHFARLRAACTHLGVKRQRNVYFDYSGAPGLPLRDAGVLVRVREEEGRVILTVKRRAERALGRIESDEYETELAPSAWESVRVGRATLGEAARFAPLDAVAAGHRLAIVGMLENLRWSCRGPDGSVYELDETTFPWGEVHYELEIESDDPAAALDRARRFLDEIGVSYDTAVETKSERLLRGPGGRGGSVTSSP